MPSRFRVVAFTAALLACTACATANAPPVALPTLTDSAAADLPPATIYPTPLVIAVTNTPEPSATQPPYDGLWYEVKPGIEYALMQGRVNARDELLLVTRLDPARISLRVLYAPDAPKTARDWQTQLGADLIVNGGFFDDQNRATGLIIADGQPFGRSYRGFGGMFAWRDAGPELWWLRDSAYRADAAIAQAVQGFPMLVIDGQPVEGMSDNGERNRRSFVAMDQQGRVLLGVTQMAQWSLTDLAQFLAQSPELDVNRALNLDGGASSGLWLGGNYDGVSMNSFDPVPAVIAVSAR